jgi:tRNA pseudouridine55 synthase
VIHGWIILDKPVGMTSTHAVAVAKRLFTARRAGHAGTLDPLASGLLPLALGEATKTVPFVMDGRKRYRFTVRWGEERDTDDAEGRVIETGSARPSPEAVAAILPQFTGTIEQVPPRFSAIKVDGERAYDLARDGEEVTLEARPVEIAALRIVRHDGPTTTFEAECGKGTYVRAIARDLGRLLGCFGHVAELRRTRVGPLLETDAIPLETLNEMGNSADGRDALMRALRPVETALDGIPALAVSGSDAAELKRGKSIILRGRDAPIHSGLIYATSRGMLVALGEVERGELKPTRVFNLPL